jgi:two-component SAPR family response regulator
VTEWERPDVRAILGFLAIRAPRAVHRDQVIDAIWPDKDAESGKKFLFRRVHSLRKALNEDSDAPFLYFRFDQYRLDPDRVWVDVAAFEERIQRARKAPDEVAEPLLAEAIELYRGELFADGCPDWAIERQEECRANMLQALNRAAACAARRGDYPTAVERYRRALALEPINEEIATNLARALHNLRDRAGIIRLQSSLVEVLRRELDDPDAELQPETQEIFDEILADLQASAARLRPADVARR